MSSYRLIMNLSYDGSGFYGWQRQGAEQQVLTIQGVLEDKIGQIMNKKVSVVASGRTDRGANALSQWAHVDVPKDPRGMNLLHKLNRVTPDSVRINQLYVGDRRFHAQQSALKKKYIYKIHNEAVPHPFRLHYFHHERHPLDLDLLNKSASYLVKTQDFKSFQNTGTDVENTVRTIFQATWVQRGNALTFHIIGDGFLKQMVRNIVGTQIWCLQQKDPVGEFVKIIESLDRRKAKNPAPAHALFLRWVKYPVHLLSQLEKLEN